MVKERHKRIWVQKLLGRIDCWDFPIQKIHQWYVIDIKYIYFVRILLLSVWLHCLYCHGYHGCSRSIDISPLGGRTVGTSNQSFLGHHATPKVDVVAIHDKCKHSYSFSVVIVATYCMQSVNSAWRFRKLRMPQEFVASVPTAHSGYVERVPKPLD